jgi:hypothetical protein
MGDCRAVSVTKPVFADQTGRRAIVLLWLGRVVVTVSVILGTAIAFTLTTHIALPGLDGLVSPTLNGSQPDIAVPTDPSTVTGSDATHLSTGASDPTTTMQRAKTVGGPSLRTRSAAVATRRAVSSSTATKTRPSTTSPTSPARPTAKPRSSHAASASTAVGKGGQKTNPTPPGQTKKPVR